MKDKPKGLYIIGTGKEVDAIINRIIAENPNMTLKEYLDKYHKDILILR